MGFCKMEEYTIDSFELLYSGAVDKIKSHKSNLNLSKFNNTFNMQFNLITCPAGHIVNFYFGFQGAMHHFILWTVLS